MELMIGLSQNWRVDNWNRCMLLINPLFII
jgi:hypothetical protein